MESVGVCPWPVGTVLRATGATFTWIFEHASEGCWYEMGNETRRDWAYVATFPNLVELVARPASTAVQAVMDALRQEPHMYLDSVGLRRIAEIAAPAALAAGR